MIKTAELMRLLLAQAEAQKAGDNAQATALQRSLNLMFPTVYCVACGNLAIRHALTLEGEMSKPGGAICNPCADEGLQLGDAGQECYCPGLTLGRPAQEIEIRRWTDPRPEDVPDGWLIFVATRPISGTKIWGQGRFFAAVDPKDQYAADLIYNNAKNDACLIQYVTMDQVREWAHGYASRNGWEPETLNQHSDDTLQRSFRHHRDRVRGHIVDGNTEGWLGVAFDTLKDQIEMVIQMVDYGNPDEALELLEAILPLLPDKAVWPAKKAAEEIKAGDPYIAGKQRLNEMLDGIGEPKIR